MSRSFAGARLDGAAGHTVICIPTYDERGNIERMLRALAPILGEHGEVIVVDDGSPDGTADLAEALAAELGRITVIRRTAKDGLGPAYLAGFTEALARGADRVIQMDCDFSHDPGDVPRLVAATTVTSATAAADVALGSRYVAGGAVVNWPRRRVLLSRAGSTYARLILGIDLRDATAGFKCYRREVLEAIPFEQVRTSGYGFNVEMTYRAITAGFTVRELPITFTERTVGESKMNGRIALEAIREIPGLRWQARQPRRRRTVVR